MTPNVEAPATESSGEAARVKRGGGASAWGPCAGLT